MGIPVTIVVPAVGENYGLVALARVADVKAITGCNDKFGKSELPSSAGIIP
jgi:hypothetical protein